MTVACYTAPQDAGTRRHKCIAASELLLHIGPHPRHCRQSQPALPQWLATAPPGRSSGVLVRRITPAFPGRPLRSL